MLLYATGKGSPLPANHTVRGECFNISFLAQHISPSSSDLITKLWQLQQGLGNLFGRRGPVRTPQQPLMPGGYLPTRDIGFHGHLYLLLVLYSAGASEVFLKSLNSCKNFATVQALRHTIYGLARVFPRNRLRGFNLAMLPSLMRTQSSHIREVHTTYVARNRVTFSYLDKPCRLRKS